MRILMMADTPADPNRGAAGTELQTARALRALGHEVDTIWAEDLGRRIQHGNLHVVLELPRTYERAAVRALREKAYDVVHVNQPHGFRAARAVHRIAPRAVFIHRSHGFELNADETLRPWRRQFGDDERGLTRRIASAALRPFLTHHSHAIAREADGHIVSASLDRDFLAGRLDVDVAKIAVISQAAPDAFVARPAPPMTSERLRHVLHIAQFAFFKAPMVTADAMNRLAAARTDLSFTWICDRAHHDLVRALLSDNVLSRIQILSSMPQDELLAAYDRSGIFLFPSFFEGFGKTFLEAMSRGLCVIASDIGGMHDVIEHGSTGVLVQPGDPGAVADAATSLLDDEVRSAAMSAAAATTARGYTWARVARETTEFYNSRLEARRSEVTSGHSSRR
jgi:glycosyltransferase involved in cell wall biosynthesis